MKIDLSEKEFRRLLDMVYIGDWILNSPRGTDRFEDYDRVMELVFKKCYECGMDSLAETAYGYTIPSRAFAEGGIHEAIADYEDSAFFDILAEELARRDMDDAGISQDDEKELSMRIDDYFAEFERNGIDNISIQ